VDGRELARKTIAHTIPLVMTVDETFDVGMDTGTGVDDSYKLPFRFTGTIDKLTFNGLLPQSCGVAMGAYTAFLDLGSHYHPNQNVRWGFLHIPAKTPFLDAPEDE
jgi:hypothetical protein